MGNPRWAEEELPKEELPDARSTHPSQGLRTSEVGYLATQDDALRTEEPPTQVPPIPENADRMTFLRVEDGALLVAESVTVGRSSNLPP